MPRPEKVQAVAEIKERIEGAHGVFLTEFRGLSVKQLSTLRRALRDSGAEYKVVKMSLARRAVDELGIDGIAEHLEGPTGLTFANADVVATAKALRDAGNDYDSLVIKAGLLTGGVVVLSDQITTLADIEPREVLLAKIAGAAKAPLYAAAGLFQSFTREAAGLFSALVDKKEQVGEEQQGQAEPAAADESEPVSASSGDAVEASTGEASSGDASATEDPTTEESNEESTDETTEESTDETTTDDDADDGDVSEEE